jgi:hypothetical protein
MNASVYGHILGSRWRPAEHRMAGCSSACTSSSAAAPGSSAYTRAEAYPIVPTRPIRGNLGSPGAMPRTPASANVSDAVADGIALDAQGKNAWGRSDIGSEGDPIISAE